MTDREPVPLHIYHYPYCLSFAFFELNEDQLSESAVDGPQREDEATDDPHAKAAMQESTILVDPTYEEECCCDGKCFTP